MPILKQVPIKFFYPFLKDPHQTFLMTYGKEKKHDHSGQKGRRRGLPTQPQIKKL